VKMGVDKPSIVSRWATLSVAETVWHHRLRWNWKGCRRNRSSYSRGRGCSGEFVAQPLRHVDWKEVYLHLLWILVLGGGEGTTSRPGRFTPGKEPKYPFNRKLGGSQSRSGRFGEEKISYVCRIRTPNRTLIAVPSTISRPRLYRVASVRIARASSEIQTQQLCTTALKRSLVGLQPHGLESISMYVRETWLRSVMSPLPQFVSLLPRQDWASPKMLEKTIRVMNRDRSSNSICLTQLLSP
jgi:hypothetical protein